MVLQMQNNHVDAKIGENIRLKRVAKRMSQADLGSSLSDPVSQTQVGKYESGDNGISAERLVDVARVLGCDLKDLFHGVEVNNG